MPEANPRITKHTVGLISIWYFNKEHILIAQRETEGMFLIKNAHFYPENVLKVSNGGFIPYGEGIAIGILHVLGSNVPV